MSWLKLCAAMEHGHERRDDLRKVLLLGETAATSSLIDDWSYFWRTDFLMGQQVLTWLGDLTWKLRLFYGPCAYRRSRRSTTVDEKLLRIRSMNIARMIADSIWKWNFASWPACSMSGRGMLPMHSPPITRPFPATSPAHSPPGKRGALDQSGEI